MRILLLSRLPNRPSERRLYDAAIARGHEVVIAKYNDISLLIGDKQGELYHANIESFAFDAVIPRLGHSNISYGLSVLRQFELGEVYTPNTSAGISRIYNYLRLIQLLTRKQLPVPRTFVSKTGIVSAEVVEHLGLPLLLHRNQEKGGSLLIETRKTLDSILQVIGGQNEPVILQELSTKDVDSRYKALVIGGSVAASMKTSKTTTKAAPLPQACAKAATKASAALGLKLYEVELVGTDEAAKILSVNPEPDFDYYERITGRNVAEKIIDYIEQNAKQRNRKDRVGA